MRDSEDGANIEKEHTQQKTQQRDEFGFGHADLALPAGMTGRRGGLWKEGSACTLQICIAKHLRPGETSRLDLF